MHIWRPFEAVIPTSSVGHLTPRPIRSIPRLEPSPKPFSRVGRVTLAPWPRQWKIGGSVNSPIFAKTLETSADADERGFAAQALGSTGDLTYLPLLRRVAATDDHFNARALSLLGIVSMLGPDSLADLRLGSNDPHQLVRAAIISAASNLLELEQPHPRWPPASDALIAEVRDVHGNATGSCADCQRRGEVLPGQPCAASKMTDCAN